MTIRTITPSSCGCTSRRRDAIEFWAGADDRATRRFGVSELRALYLALPALDDRSARVRFCGQIS
jgi:hypothetical protein